MPNQHTALLKTKDALDWPEFTDESARSLLARLQNNNGALERLRRALETNEAAAGASRPAIIGDA